MLFLPARPLFLFPRRQRQPGVNIITVPDGTTEYTFLYDGREVTVYQISPGQFPIWFDDIKGKLYQARWESDNG